MRNTKYDYSSVHVEVPAVLSDDIIAWGKKHISDDEIFVSQQDPTFGREDEIHVTILYGLHTETSEVIKDLLSEEKPIHVRLGETKVFSNPNKFDVVVIDVISPDLRRLNDKFAARLPHTNKYGEYNPHITVAFVKKGKGWQYMNCTRWEGQEFACSLAVFSSKNGTKERIFFAE